MFPTINDNRKGYFIQLWINLTENDIYKTLLEDKACMCTNFAQHFSESRSRCR